MVLIVVYATSSAQLRLRKDIEKMTGSTRQDVEHFPNTT